MKLFYKDYKYSKRKDGMPTRKYEVYHILFFKFSKRVLYDDGYNNSIFINSNGTLHNIKYNKKYKNLLNGIIIQGNNNLIILPTDLIDNKSSIYILITGNNNKITINPTVYRVFLEIVLDCSDSLVNIGKNLSSANCSIVIDGKGINFLIGNDCMFSSNVKIRNTDGHAIFDKTTNKYLNPCSNIKIGDHVWLGMDSSILKNTSIPDGCIVGMNTLVNKQFTEPNCIIAGVPAKVVKHNVRWER